MAIEEIRVPDLGDFEAVDVVDVLVSPGDEVKEEDSLITLESEKATMDVPSPRAGKIEEVKVAKGDKVSQGDVIAVLEVGEEGEGEEEEEAEREGEKDEEEPAAPGAAEDEEKPREPERDEPKAEERGAKRERRAAEPEGRRAERETRGPALPEADLRAQLVVLGSGPGGYTAAFRAADLGLDVVLVERYPTLGGVCLNVGCIPSKALLHAAKVIEEAAFFAEHGVVFGEPRLDLEKLRGWKDSVVGRLTKGLAQLAKQRKVRVVQGSGRFTSPHRLEVQAGDGGATSIAFEHAIVAAGSRPIELPGIPHGDPRVMDSTTALELEEVPGRLLVVGGGIIGLEMAALYGALGSELTIVELTDALIPGCDPDLVRPLQKRLEEHLGARVLLETKVEEVEARERELVARFAGGGSAGGKSGPSEPASFDRVLIAVGRKPNSDRIGLEAAGIEVDEQGWVKVDRQRRTSVGHCFAIGDITGPPLLAHKATHEGKVAAEAAAGGKSAFDARAIPSVAFTDPEVAWAGLSETRAAAEGVAYEKGTFPWAASGRSLGLGRDEGLTKILFDPGTRRVVGAGIVGPNAGDLISELALAIEMGCEAADVGMTIHPHPTLSETVAFAAEAYDGTLTELYKPKRRRS